MFPPIPDWDAMHPFAVHFAVALAFAAVLFVPLGLLPGQRGRDFAVAALLLMALASCASIISVSTGTAAARLAERNADAEETLVRHERNGRWARNAQIALSMIYAAIVLIPAARGREPGATGKIAMTAVFLAAYAGFLVLLLWVGHDGGLLVHEHGIRALLPK
ncbi:MAG: hypothetical protein N3A38_03785 [Planctomycetota bacterium]|nr:hypothetical protein [Planctomycetota bacterium]